MSDLSDRTSLPSLFCPTSLGSSLPLDSADDGPSRDILYSAVASGVLCGSMVCPPAPPSGSMLPPPPEKALEPQACVSPKSVTSSSRKCQHYLSTSSASWALFRFRLCSLFDPEADSRMVALDSPFLLLLLSLWPGSPIHPQKWLPPLLCPSPGLVQPASVVAGSHPALPCVAPCTRPSHSCPAGLQKPLRSVTSAGRTPQPAQGPALPIPMPT